MPTPFQVQPVKDQSGNAYLVQGFPAIGCLWALDELTSDLMRVVITRNASADGTTPTSLQEDGTVRLNKSNASHGWQIQQLIGMLLTAWGSDLAFIQASVVPQDTANCQILCGYIASTNSAGGHGAILDALEAYSANPLEARIVAKRKVADPTLFASRLATAQTALNAANAALTAAQAQLATDQAENPQVPATILADQQTITSAQASVNSASALVAWRQALVNL